MHILNAEKITMIIKHKWNKNKHEGFSFFSMTTLDDYTLATDILYVMGIKPESSHRPVEEVTEQRDRQKRRVII